MSPQQLQILQHALGVDEHGQGSMYRNHYCAGGDDEADCRELVRLGFMKEHQRTDVFPYYNCSVTDAGKQAVRDLSPVPPKLTRSQKRYRMFLNWADAGGGSFKDFLQYEKEHTQV
jgi:hypothetical protein